MIITVELVDEEREAVQALRRERQLTPAERDRVEMVLLSSAGWLAPRIATHLGYCAATVRTTLKSFKAEGVASIRKGKPGPPPDTERRAQVTAALDALLGADRTWTAAQLATALGEQGIALSTRQTRKYLVRMGARWRRTVTTLRHKQNAGRVAQATITLASLKKKATAGRLRLAYLDECGFSPSQPVTTTWVRKGERTRMPYENPQGRRLNALASLVTDGPVPALFWVAKSGSYTAEHIVCFLQALPPVSMPTVLVLDNAGIHRSKIVRAARPALWARGIYLYYLPPYSPELNAIERSFRTIKHHHLPARRYATLATLDDAVQAAFTAYEERLIQNTGKQPRLAA